MSTPTPVTNPFPTNPTTTIVNQVIDTVWEAAVKAAEAALIAAVPEMDAPVIEQVSQEVIQLVANALYKQFALLVSFEIIDFQDAGELNAQQKALIALKAAQKLGDTNVLAQALKNFDDATEALTHLDGRGTS